MMTTSAALLRARRTMVRASAFLLLLLLVLAAPARLVAGRGDKVGSASGTQLLIPVGARALGLAGSTLATVTGNEAVYWNPAGLSRSEHATGIFVSHMAYLADIGVDYVALSTRVAGFGTLGLAVKSLSIGSIPITTEDLPDGTGETVTPSFMVIGGTFSRRMSDQISLGFTTNLILERMGEVSATGIAFNGGIQYLSLGGVEGLNFGVAVKNVGPQMKYDGDGLLRNGQLSDISRPDAIYKIEAASADLPSTIEIGLGYTRDLNELSHLTATGMFQNNNFADDEYRFGLEYDFRDLLFVRGGFAFSSVGGDQEYVYGSSAGAGIRTTVEGVEISVDYGFREVKYLRGNHVFTLSLEL
jgi:hypothetical protein